MNVKIILMMILALNCYKKNRINNLKQQIQYCNVILQHIIYNIIYKIMYMIKICNNYIYFILEFKIHLLITQNSIKQKSNIKIILTSYCHVGNNQMTYNIKTIKIDILYHMLKIKSFVDFNSEIFNSN